MFDSDALGSSDHTVLPADGRRLISRLSSSKWHGATVAGELQKMTIIFESDQAKKPWHVLIVCVAGYDGSRFGELPGAVRSAERAARYWSSPKTRLAGSAVGSVDVVMSAGSSRVELCDGEGGTLERATLANVQNAFARWVRQCAADPGSNAVLHWIGHGTDEFESTGTEISRLLFCEDEDIVRERQNAVSLSLTAGLLKRLPGSDRVLLFIDTCRDEIDREPAPEYPDALGVDQVVKSAMYDLPTRNNRVVCYGLAYPGDKPRSYPDPNLECSFKGGTLFTEAALDAIQVFGAERACKGGDWFSMTNTLASAISERLGWWRDYLGHTNVLECGMSRTIPTAIAHVEAPAAMVKAHIARSAAHGGLPSDIDLLWDEHGSAPSSVDGVTAPVVKRYRTSENWRGTVPAGSWRPDHDGLAPGARVMSQPPKREEFWTV